MADDLTDDMTDDENEISGTDRSETLFGTDNGETIDAGKGNDLVFAGGGDDTIAGGEGNDWLFGDDGDDFIEGGDGHDVLIGGAGDDTIDGGADHDYIVGGDGDDSLFGGSGHDVLVGDAGSDTLDGGADNDWLGGGTGDDTLTGGTGDDIFFVERDNGNDTITDFADGGDLIDLREFTQIGSVADLAITADGDDVVIDLGDYGGGTIRLENVSESDLGADHFVFYRNEGDDGDNRLLGASGDDTLTGGAGDDTMTGYGGDDTFVFGPNDGNDTITDFDECADAIDLTAFNTITGMADLTITTDGSDAIIDLSDHGGGTIRLADYYDQDASYAARLDSSDFVFSEAPLEEPSIDGI